jgi:AraC-like DNA-binding protein
VIYFSRDFYYLNMADKDLLFEMPFLNNNTSRPCVELSDGDFGFFKQVFDAVSREFNGGAEHKEEVIRSYLNIILIECRRRFDSTRDEAMFRDKSSLRLFRDFKVLLEKHFVEYHQVQDYAGMLAITDKYLNELSKKTVGMTASELIHDRIVLEARRLLLHSELSNKEVAFHLKFEDPSHFSKFFKKKTGYTPTDFRTVAREKYNWHY